MRQYAGFGTAAETNARFRHLLDAGQTGLSVAFDLPTQMGIDSDSPARSGEVGRVGVAIDSVDDMHVLLAGIPLDRVSTSMTINATAAILLAMYLVVAEERGHRPQRALAAPSRTTFSRSTSPAAPTSIPPARAATGRRHLPLLRRRKCPSWNPISISGYHIREAGATAVQELAFTLANAMEYVRAGRWPPGIRGRRSSRPRLSFFFAAHNDLFEEAAKFRAARRLYAAPDARALRGRRCQPAACAFTRRPAA